MGRKPFLRTTLDYPERIRTATNTHECRIKSTGMLKGYGAHMELVVLVDRVLYSSFTGRLLLFHDQYQALDRRGWPKGGEATGLGPHYQPHREERSYSLDEVEEFPDAIQTSGMSA